jgi:hypothetical protein
VNITRSSSSLVHWNTWTGIRTLKLYIYAIFLLYAKWKLDKSVFYKTRQYFQLLKTHHKYQSDTLDYHVFSSRDTDSVQKKLSHVFNINIKNDCTTRIDILTKTILQESQDKRKVALKKQFESSIIEINDEKASTAVSRCEQLSLSRY